jgi:hypothetical protein
MIGMIMVVVGVAIDRVNMFMTVRECLVRMRMQVPLGHVQTNDQRHQQAGGAAMSTTVDVCPPFW